MASKISKEVQEFVKGKLGWVATVNPDGMPNVTPKGTVQVLDEHTIIFADLFSVKTRDNLRNNPNIAVTVVDLNKFTGYQFKGKAELIDTGPLYDKVKEDLKKAPTPLPEPRYVAKITVEEIYDQSPGPNAGKKIG
ncbi:pyridoxamine 5'-phosphate oxidase family protein [Desulfococcus multivorans]|uniref:Pyridoxamine 5-phosphate oxidase-related FMN-binding protein n=1 Tax=Desulfococcus multivorans DSM 2059 TaxID=1121405 RepID=S7UTC6_DESML|nr:pyridoxamine 5'-phosphate oxidase family protein [Desulfococcus multivorans]AOY57234.1 pyridoxamine 5-phosphate oxidase-related protein, FMN-binding [Desulfococcus multivorans]AQU99696.1 pyridoxamine 5'-phosphate oxidase [Desulfococcus multivorans]EPR37274.1 pyridoxamine 5-phosphate oxidase-related FMN-binding protein [Desulfococcus multivorans DSM 2059]SKA25949.1 hypothetical protein SAMN02745446_03593 [Desulfococcus multivorans DSM 2059]